MSKMIVGLFVGAVAALAVGAATQPAVRDRVRLLAASCCGDAEGQSVRIEDATGFVKRAIEAVGERFRGAAEESRVAAAEERQRLWKHFERARDTGRADVELSDR